MIIEASTDLGASLKQNGLGARTPTKGKSADGLGSPVVEAIEHLVQTFMTQRVHEGFTSVLSVHAETFKNPNWRRLAHMYGPGRPLRAWNSSAVSSVKAGPLIYFECQEMHLLLETTTRKTYRFGCTPGFFLGDLLNSTLDLGDIHSLVVNLDHAAQNGAHLGELVLIARDEIELGQSHDGCG